MTGILFGDRMGATYARRTMSPLEFIQQQQVLHMHFVRMLPFLTLGSVLGAIL